MLAAGVPFKVLVVAGGSGGGSNGYVNGEGYWETGGRDPWGGLGGAVVSGDYAIPGGNHTITIGNGGAGSLGGSVSGNPPPWNGNASSIGSVVTATGGNTIVNGISSTISGSTLWFSGQGVRCNNYNSSAGGSGQQGWPPYQAGGAGAANTGGGGGGAYHGGDPHGECGASGPGGTGVIYIAYEIAP